MRKINIHKAEVPTDKEYKILRQANWIYLNGWLNQTDEEKKFYIESNNIDKSLEETDTLHRCIWYMIKHEKEAYITIPQSLWDCIPGIVKDWSPITFMII